MTNSRLTDPEVLEERAPVCLERFALRPKAVERARLKRPRPGAEASLP